MRRRGGCTLSVGKDVCRALVVAAEGEANGEVEQDFIGCGRKGLQAT